jgi:anti-sigma regulatory factor (Ser/Thr protein kinase)
MISGIRQAPDAGRAEVWPHVLAAIDPPHRGWAAPTADDPYLARLQLPAAPWVIRNARTFLRDTLTAWAMPDMGDDATTVVSELVTNAVQHGSAAQDGPPTGDALPISLFLSGRGQRLVTVVTDPGQPAQASARPAVAHAGRFAEAGRGLLIVDALTDAWGWGRLPGGQTAVWAIFQQAG